MRQTLTIKLKHYLQEFLLCHLGDDAALASKKNIIGAILAPMIEYAPKDYVFSRKIDPSYITFELPDKLGGKDTMKGKIFLSEFNQKNFERILSIYFKQLFFQYVDDKIRYHPEIKQCILQFCADYNISFNYLNYEMLKKSYYRKTKSQKKPLFFMPCCP